MSVRKNECQENSDRPKGATEDGATLLVPLVLERTKVSRSASAVEEKGRWARRSRCLLWAGGGLEEGEGETSEQASARRSRLERRRRRRTRAERRFSLGKVG